MKSIPEKIASKNVNFVQLSLPLYSKPLLDIKKKVRGKKIREGFEILEDTVCPKFQAALDGGEIKSVEARIAIREFLVFVQGAK